MSRTPSVGSPFAAELMSTVVLSFDSMRFELDRPDTRIVATTLLSRPGEARTDLGRRLRAATRPGPAVPVRLREAECNALLLALGEVERDGLSSPAIRAIETGLRHGSVYLGPRTV